MQLSFICTVSWAGPFPSPPNCGRAEAYLYLEGFALAERHILVACLFLLHTKHTVSACREFAFEYLFSGRLFLVHYKNVQCDQSYQNCNTFSWLTVDCLSIGCFLRSCFFVNFSQDNLNVLHENAGRWFRRVSVAVLFGSIEILVSGDWDANLTQAGV